MKKCATSLPLLLPLLLVLLVLSLGAYVALGATREGVRELRKPASKAESGCDCCIGHGEITWSSRCQPSMCGMTFAQCEQAWM